MQNQFPFLLSPVSHSQTSFFQLQRITISRTEKYNMLQSNDTYDVHAE